MKGPCLGLPLVLIIVVFGYISAESEKDFVFAGDKDSYGDDEDFMSDQEGSGEIDGSGEEIDRPTGIPGLYRLTLNITNFPFTDEIRLAGRNLGSLSITSNLVNFLQEILADLGGTINIQVVSIQPGSLMVTYDIQTDGSQTEEEIRKKLNEIIASRQLGIFDVSPEGFNFYKIRDAYTCPPTVGVTPDNLPSTVPSNDAYLMVNQAFSCDGFITAWKFVRQRNNEDFYIGVFRQYSDTSYTVVDFTRIPIYYDNFINLQDPILVRKGDFIGVFADNGSIGGSLVYASKEVSGDAALKNLLFQTYKVSIYSDDLVVNKGIPFEMTDYSYSEDQALFAVQAQMNYENVPAAVTPAPKSCGSDEWTCKNGDCIPREYYCDGQRDCYDGSDEDNCGDARVVCSEGEFRCANGQQCIPVQFECNYVDDCGDNSDEASCGPRPVSITSYRDGIDPTRFTVSWRASSDRIISYTIKYRPVTIISGQFTADGNYIIERPLSNWVSVQLSSATEQFVIQNLSPDSYYEVEISALNEIGASEPRAFVFKTSDASCGAGEWQCKDGNCIDISGRCNDYYDCADSSDEDNCDTFQCPEALFLCTYANGSIDCVDDPSMCIEICKENEFQCLDGHGCFKLTALCDGIIDCKDLSDEANCECLEGEFQCVQNRNCIQGSKRCDGRDDCGDLSDEVNCPCPDGYIECLNTPTQECVSESLTCDGYNDCSNGADEVNCGCADNQWQCADSSCIPSNMRCDGRPQCEDLSDENGCECANNEFTCNDGSCIPDSMRCDGRPQCEDQSDEDNCPCLDGMFQCLDGNCVEGRMRCDGVPQCEDGSDEFGCPTEPPSCPVTDFQCRSNRGLECINRRLQCDGNPDCSDGSDEQDCPGCKRNEFTCRSDERCIPLERRCDGNIDCADRSDELDNCVCTQNQFTCGDGLCIDLSRRCDRRIDCDDRSDELACPCQSGEFQCLNGDCINEQRRCDGRSDCIDGSDEQNCPSRRRCSAGFYQCGTGHCLPDNRRCDGYPDCPDESDEQNCPLRCRQGEMECPIDNKCLTPDQICNRVYDCPDGRDERNCVRCTTGEFECESDRSCISSAGRCNGRKECADGSDEMNCPTLPPISLEVSPRELRIREGAQALLTCMAQGLPSGAGIEWYRGSQGLPIQSAVESGKLMIPVAKEMDSGTYTCRVTGVTGDFQASARLEVVPYGPTPQPDGGSGVCGRDEAVCQNGECIRREYRCDGEPDCSDGSDEPQDCFANLCEPNEHRCPSGQCIMKIWRCDGEADCDDGSDERGCEIKSPDAPCAPDEFECVSGDQCVPLAYQCDQEIDCLDRSDEIGCSKPVIILPPVKEIEVELGGSFTIICEAVGVPTPLIVWRLNWGNIPTGERITVTSQNGRGQLTVTDARYEDAGAYTCEAVNNRGSIFAIPDAFVIVRLLLAESRHHLQENILVIGGTDYIHLLPEDNYVTMGVSSQCIRDLNLTMVGPRLYAKCDSQGTDVEIAYVGHGSVDFEIVKRILKIDVRGDVLPESEQDMVIVHIGGLPEDMVTEEKHMQVISGVSATNSVTDRRTIVIGGQKRNKYRPEKQIIHLGVTINCFGNLSLEDHINERKILKCLHNDTYIEKTDTRIVTGTNETIIMSAPEVIYVAGRVPQKKRKKLSKVVGQTVTDTKQEVFVTFEGPDVTETETPDIVAVNNTFVPSEIEPELIMISSNEDSSEMETKNVDIVVTGQRETVSMVTVGGLGLNDKIVGEIFEIGGSSNIDSNNIEKYVKIGAGQVCNNKIKVQLVGSSIVCQCERRNITIEYIGNGPTDFEVTHKEYMIENGPEWTNFQSQDHILMYIGGIPSNLKDKMMETYIVRGVSSDREPVGNRTKKERVVEIMGSGENVRWTKRQIVMIGVSRRCEDSLKTVSVEGKHVIECAASEAPTPLLEIVVTGNHESGVDIEREQVVVGHSPAVAQTELENEIILTGHSPVKSDTSQTGLESEIVLTGHSPDTRTEVEHHQVVVGNSTNVNQTNIENEIILTGHSPVKSKTTQTNLEREIVLTGHSPATGNEIVDVVEETVEVVTDAPDIVPLSEHVDERLLIVGGTDRVDVDETRQRINIGFSGRGCLSSNSYRVMSEDNNLLIDCQRQWAPINVIFVGKNTTDIYIGERETIDDNQRDLSLYFGGGPDTSSRSESVVEIIKNVGTGRRTGVRKVTTFGGQTTPDGRTKKVHIEVGFSASCPGTLHKVESYGRVFIDCRVMRGNTVESVVEVIGKNPAVDKPKTDIVVMGGREPAEPVMRKEIIVRGGGAEETVTRETVVDRLFVDPLPVTRVAEPVTNKPPEAVLIVEPIETVIEKKRIGLTGVRVNLETTTVTSEQSSATIGVGSIDIDVNTKKFEISQREEKFVNLIGKLEKEKQTTPLPDVRVGIIENERRNNDINIAVRNENIFSNDTLSKNVTNVILIGQHNHVDIDQTGQNFYVGFINKCGSDFNVVVNGRRVTVYCQENREFIELIYVGEIDSEFQINTYVGYRTWLGTGVNTDSVFVQLGGLHGDNSVDQSGIRSHFVNISIAESEMEEKSFNIRSRNEIVDGNDDQVRVVEIGIKRKCGEHGVGKYVNEEGTVVYCRRRADILPEEYGYTKETHKSESSPWKPALVGPSGEFIEVETERLNTSMFVSSVPVDIGQNGTDLDNVRHSANVDVGMLDRKNKPRRGDVTVEEAYDLEFTSAERSDNSNDMPYREYSVFKSDTEDGLMGTVFPHSEDNSRNGTIIHYGVEYNKSVAIDINNNCKGTIEAMEVTDGVIVKCTIDGQNVDVNLVGLKNGHHYSSLLQDDPNIHRLDQNGNFITGRKFIVPGQFGENFTLTEVYYASRMKYIDEPRRRQKRTVIAVETVFDQYEGIKYRNYRRKDNKLKAQVNKLQKFTVKDGRSADRKNLLPLNQIYRHKTKIDSIESTKGLFGKVKDKVKSLKGQKSLCSSPFFNFGATTVDDCVRCFCFGQSVQCFSSDLQVSSISLANTLDFVRREVNGQRIPVDETFINYRQRTAEYQVRDMSRVLEQGRYYWSLPREFLGDRLTSYGGELKYTIYYDIEGRSAQATNDVDVIIGGNGMELYYRARTIPSVGVPTSISVPLIETQWERSDGSRRRGDTPVDSQYANREDFMTVLQNVEYVLIRGTYDRQQSTSRIGGLFMTTAVDYPTEYGQAYLVEECTCPTGYTGLSCQNCAPGFMRDTRGGRFGPCVSCNCNGHSNDCDTATGQCLNCQHNTEGPQCQVCANGYYGNARGGTPNDCQPCPCPLTVASNQFSSTCYLDTDNEVTCANCPTGYEGRRCERCSEGYTGDPMTIGSTCIQGPVDYYCDPRGSESTTPNPFTGKCKCKENVFSNKCDTCKENTFYLSSSYELGCVRCFCMGVTNQCQSTSWNRAQVGVPLTRDDSGVKITDSNGNVLQNQRPTLTNGRRELVFRSQDNSQDILYWTLPSVFLGDKVMSYGGSFRFTVSYQSRQGVAVSSSEPLVKMSGNDITLIYRTRQEFQPNRPQSINIVMYEQNWFRVDGQPATREHLLMALADLDTILIRATFETPQVETGIRDITLDIAENRQTRQDRAYAVESCQCPVGYRGLSCEDCDTGYTRSGGGLYLGLCEPCNCNGHSNECDPETGVCRNCQDNTEGDYCEMCAVGYYGDATVGRRNDCQKCPCPLTESPNQFSPTCKLDVDGQVTCTACPAGHTGRRCESCIDGYSGNPNQVGDYCKIGPNINCNCDQRGIVPNTQCDENTLQCQCKPYVQGLRCARCREGYFYLESNNPQGCLTCFCSGITNQCTSSNYYRDALRPMLASDDSHNFVLMNRRMNNIISDGFVVDSSRNQITYNRFEGVQRERESLFFQLPPKFRGDRVTSYGGYLRFTLEFSARPTGRMYRDVDFEIISAGQALRLYHLFEPSLQEGKTQTYEILLRESSFNDLRSNSAPTRETFMTILSNVEGILIRATYHENMQSVTLRDVTMDTAVATPTNVGGAPMVEDCRCPEGYTGLSCQRCAQGYLRVSDGRGGLGRCVRCNCNGHATSCDPDTGRCLECQHNTEGDRCERCVSGYYGDATSGTPNDCRACPCPLTTSPNQFSPTCYLAEDNRVTCDRCPTGYTGRQCQTCAEGYIGEPSRPGGSCRLIEVDRRPIVNVSPIRVEEPEGSTAVFQCQVNGDGPFNVVWSRLDRRPLPDRASSSPNYALTIRNLNRDDSGKYICAATNRYGVTRKEVELKVIYGQTPLQVRIDRPRIEIEEGRTARFVCTISGATRDMTYIISWSRQGGQVPSKAIDQNGVLVIPNVQRSDAGNYVCTGSDMLTMDEEVAVLIVSGGSIQAPTVRIEPRYQEVDEGSQVRFMCFATGQPKPRVEWYRGGNREMNPSAIITSDGEFRIPRVALDDESDYYCKATNDAGTTELRTILYVKRVDRPTITIIVRQTKYVAIAGETARLECYVEDASGRVTLFWSRQTGLPSGSTQDNGILTIPDVQPSYAGNYVCTGTDSESGRTSQATALLEVTVDASVAPKVTLNPEKITIPMGSTGTLRCEVSGSPEPVVTWMKSREQLASNHQVNGKVLRITQATMADRGIYVCRAENDAGVDQDWTIVEVERRMRPKIDLYPNTTTVVAAGGSALFQCRVMDGDPPPTVTWSRVGGLPLTEGKVELMDNGVIMFKQVTTAEQGGYICTAENDMGTTTATATLIVEGPPSITIQPSRTVYALIGQRVTLECTADGDPTPSVYWIEPSRPSRGDILPEAEYLDAYATPGTAVLDINSVSRSDQGTYTCVARNSGGQTQDRVQLIIRESGNQGVSIQGPSTLSVVDGQSVELVCSANQFRDAVIRWRRREGALPPGHRVNRGVLTLPRFPVEYAGEYICSTVVQQQTYEASVFIIVTVAPRLTISPQRITSRAGDTIQLRCTASGSGPFDIEWSRVDAQINPSATERDGVLEIRQVTAADAGRYRCVVRSSTAGSSEGFALVVVEVPPNVVVTQRSVYTEVNRDVELRCDATGNPQPIVSWQKEGGELPAEHTVVNGVLTIYNVREQDAGRYICTASSSSGSNRDYAVLNVGTGSSIGGGGSGGGESIDTQVVNVGDRVSMECIVTGSPLPTITWSRDDGPLPADAIFGDGVLILPQAKIEHAGTYTCLASNEVGSIKSKVVLYVRAQPRLSAPLTATAALGDRATLVCDAGGYPSPAITWFRKDGAMPSDYTIVDGDLVISRVRQEDAGTYVCHAENQYGKTDTPVNLNVGALVPYFKQDPNSYMAYKSLNDVYLDFDILLSLKPESTEGMVLYNGQFEDGGGDFVCFGLNEGYPEFRFDVGSGPAIIRGNQTLGLNEWHTVQLTRNKKKGSMVINEQPAYTGESPGFFTGLDLDGKMYLGSVPNYDQIPRVTNFKEGFVGSISEVKIKGIDLNLGEEALEIVGVEPYNTCRVNPCANGGVCSPANVRYGFICICPQGYMGSRCEQVGERCYPGACGRDGRCYNLDSGYGFRCICPVGKTGAGCQADVLIIYPFFNRTSFISYPPAEDALFALNIKLEYKPQSLSDGIILYEGNEKDGNGDFMALIQKDGYLEFRFDTGSGPAVIRSRTPLRIDEWTRVVATRKEREGTLVVNDDEPVTASSWPGTSPGSTVGLNLKLPLFLGGPDPTVPVSENTGVTRGFIGCVAELTVNDFKYDLITDAIESVNIADCGERRLCEREPCRNNGVCEDLPGPDYRCLCPASHTGKLCEIEINICLTNSPCQNGSPCSITNDGYRCDCILGFAGDNCQYAVRLDTDFKYEGDGFLELTKDLLPHSKSQERQTMSFTIQTTQSDGLVMWQGDVGGRPLRGGDHIGIGLRSGYVEFSYEMGSGPAMILSNERVDDGQVHTISVERLGRSGTLTIDNNESVYGDSLGYLQMLNADGNIYIGGVSTPDVMTDGKYTENFIGCISNVNIQGKGPLESRDAIGGFNVQPCTP